ncbi:putative F-box and associated interaction domains-containing protein [Heracleum sosnowskyi]|uniref:F-box and associated interaction domains-containing protein n=1 Tax=Heracleum sosnowskyi TaxID=360622 RepID=A0AAD8LZ14_9APIA|nr:putative F-box and associated interaction domains-containing protein [Heracleum sosnowskyi]
MDLKLEMLIKRKCKAEEDNRRIGLDRLPTDIALDIFLRLPVISVIQSTFVCRYWRSLLLDQHLATLHLSRAVNRNPMLFFHSDYPIRNELCFAELPASDDNDDEKGIVKKISTPFSASMPEFTVEGSCNGLLCLSDTLYKDALYIYNPLTRDYKELPKTRQYEEETVVYGFGYHPGTKEYKVVKIVHHWIVNFDDQYVRRRPISGTSKSEVLVLTLGRNAWRNVGLAPYHLERRSHEAVFTNGRLHWLYFGFYENVRGLIIISFDLAEEKFYEVPRPNLIPIDGRNYHLAILNGCLSAVVYGHGLRRDLEIWVMKEYNVKESWIKEFKFRSYVPAESPCRKLPRPVRTLRNNFRHQTLRVLCTLENGGILIEYNTGRLVVYDPENGKYKEIVFEGMPGMFQTVVHTGSLNRIDLPIQM